MRFSIARRAAARGPALTVGGIILLFLLSGCSPRINLDLLGEPSLTEVVIRASESENKIAVVDVMGMIRSGEESGLLSRESNIISRIVSRLQKAEQDPLVRGLILRIDSPGGEVTASDIIYHEIIRFRDRTGIPVVVSMLGLAASGGYYIACAGDRIFAHPSTVTGSIGVISVFPNGRDLLEKMGLDVTVIKSGEMKDAGSLFREMREEEKAVFQDIIDTMYRDFLEVVHRNRKLAMEDLRPLADGRIFTAAQAREAGLIDGIAYFDGVFSEILALAGINAARVVTYSYRPGRKTDLYARETGGFLPATLTETLRSLMNPLSAGFYYLWSPDLAGQLTR